MRSFTARARARSLPFTALNSSDCRSAMTLPAPDRRPLQPSTSELNSHELCVVSTVTGRGRFCNSTMCRSCCGTLFDQSLMARIVGTASSNRASVSRG